MIGCLCIHGFTGAPYEVEPLAAYLKDHTDWNVKLITLPGHGKGQSLKSISYQEWIREAEQALEKLLDVCESVYVIGFSMGGIISSYLTSKYNVEKLVLLSAAAYYVNPKQLFLDTKEMVRDFFSGDIVENELFQRYKKKISDTPFTATLEFQRLVKKLKPSLTKITVPTLIIQGECDGIVPLKSAEYIFGKIPSQNKQIKYLPNSKHHVCHGEDQDELFDCVLHFLQV